MANLERAVAELGGELRESYLLDGGREAELRKRGQRFVWASNGTHLYLSIPSPNVAVTLQLGRRDWNEPVYRMFGAVPMYLGEPPYEGLRPVIDATGSWIAHPANVALVEELDLKRNEWASFHPGWSVAQLRAREGAEDFRRVDVALRIVEAATDASAPWLRKPRVRAEAVPARFRDLLPWVRRWAIDDDAIRSDRMARARTTTLLALWSAVGPRLDEIDEYLDSEGDGATYEALKLGRLAETTAEARIELEARGINLSG